MGKGKWQAVVPPDDPLWRTGPIASNPRWGRAHRRQQPDAATDARQPHDAPDAPKHGSDKGEHLKDKPD